MIVIIKWSNVDQGERLVNSCRNGYIDHLIAAMLFLLCIFQRSKQYDQKCYQQ